MKNKLIAFYVSSHGFGHMTRSLAIIEELLEKTDHVIYLVCDKIQNEFAENYLNKYKDRMIYNNFCTDVGLINLPNTLEVNKKKLEKNLFYFIESWEHTVEKEVTFLKQFDVHCVLTDISPIGALIGKELKIKNIGLSNFTWVDQYEYLSLDNKIIEAFKKAYLNLDLFIEYPLALPMNHLKIPRKNIGFTARKINLERVKQIKEIYGKSIFITCGKSANLKSLFIENYEGTIFTTSGINIIGNCNVIELPVDTLDTQNYIAASDIIIAKAGWSTISEAILANKKLVLIERNVLEDSHNIKGLKRKNVVISIKENELKNIDMKDIEQKTGNLKKLKRIEGNKNSIIELLEIDLNYSKAK